MKKLFHLLLCALLVLGAASCSAKQNDDVPADESETAVQAESPAEENTPEAGAPEDVPEEPETQGIPENVEVTTITPLELSKPAEIINGTLVMYFKDEEVWYQPDASCSIGMISEDAADSIPGSLDMTTFPDMFAGEDYTGAAIVPSTPIPSGSYTFSVLFANYLVTFDMTVD